MPDDVDLADPPSLGLRLIVLLGRQLKAEFSINRRRPTGFLFRFGTGT
jgi:two-component sensor histidine kinase